ncbi:MAG: TonB-dependent receptor [Cytophagales bacterium]|nr:TonB-dependent receptor [Cytophagales bacterium]
MKINLLLLLKKVSKIVFYSILIQCTIIGVLLADTSIGQVKNVKEVYVELSFNDNELHGVLETIENNTEFEFSYDQGIIDINQPVKLDEMNYSGDLYHLLMAISEKTNLKFKQIHQNITISRRSKSIFNNERPVEVLQERNITGSVKDESGSPLPGVNVLLKGTSSGAVTDINGAFILSIPDENAVLSFSFIGYLSEEVVVGNRSVVEVSLVPDLTSLEEVVIVGYGTERKQKVTSAISTVSGDRINNVVTGNATQALIGKAPGVRVEVNGGAPGASTNVIIRGTGSLSNQNPLYVIDGVFSDDMSFLNPADIESIDVLKDAAAASIYGARAGQGVVLVTTKSGRTDQPLRIEVDASLGFANAVRQLDFLNADDYVANREAAFANDNIPLTGNFYDFDPDLDTDIQNESLQTGLVQNYSIRFFGGGADNTYNISINHLDQEGPVKYSRFGRTSLRVNTNMKKGLFTLDQSFYMARSTNRPNEAFGREHGHLPVSPIYSETNEGGYAAANTGVLGTDRSINHLGVAALRENTTTNDNILANIGASFDIVDGLKYKLNLSLNYLNSRSFSFTPTFFFANGQSAFNEIADLSDSRSTFLSTIMEHLLSYEKSFGKHNLSLLAGYSQQSDTEETIRVQVENFVSNDTRTIDAGIDFVGRGGGLFPRNIRSIFGRVNYDYDSRYLISASIRQDGSSNFGPENRLGVFPAISMGWNIAQESFFNSNFIDDLKLRGSWGVLGSDNLRPFQYVSALNITSQYTLGAAQQRTNGVAQIEFANPDLKWEETVTSNIGIEAGLFEGKMDVVMDYFIKESNDILVSLPLNPSSGTTQPIPFNAASLRNSGLEFLLTYKNYNSDFKYSVTGNFSTLNNEVTSLGEGVNPITGGAFTGGVLFATRTEPGFPVGYFYGFQTDGIYQSQEEIDAHGISGRTAQPGDFRYVDTNGDGQFTNEDQVMLGSPIPDIEYGLNLTGSYKGFDLSLFFQGVAGNEIFNGQLYHGVFQPNSPKRAIAGNAWTEQNPSNTVPRASFNLARSENHLVSDFYVEDGSYFRLQNMALGYTFSSGILEKIAITNLRTYLNIENVFIIDNYSGYYPEVGRTQRGNTLFDRGVDENVYPVSRTITLGLQVSF